ncbi:MAG: hypothetical protein ACFFBC_01015 [Promethearchaeota archaeon]
MKKIIVTGSGGPAGINFIRSLRSAKEKFHIIGTDINKMHLEWPDVDERYIVPKFADKNYLSKINELIKITSSNFIHPQPDGEVLIFSENREKIKTKTFLPNKKTIRICQNKYDSAKIWNNNDIPVADAIEINNEKDIKEAEKRFGYPYWMRATRGFSSRGSTLVENIKTAIHWLGYWRSRGIDWEFIAQEYLPGANIAFQSIWRDGELVTSQARERLEYLYPYLAPSGTTNTPVVAVTIHRDDVNDIASRCVKVIDEKATGIFCVDLKENKDGIPCPTEINAGRFFTTSFFFTKAGVNMPYYYIKLAFDEEIPTLPKYNAIPKNLYWIRHIDAPAILKKGGEWRSIKI